MIKKLEEMVYTKEPKKRLLILAYGEIDNRHFFVLNIGGNHPTAYVEVFDETTNIDNIDVHGGITFGPEPLSYVKKCCQKVDEKVKNALDYTYIGWDYAHLGDYTASTLFPEEDNKKWSVDAILDDVMKVLDQLED